MHRATGLPSCISFTGHFTALHLEFGDPKASSLPQNARSHTRNKFQSILAALFESQKGTKSDPKFHGKMSDATKKSLAERLAARLGEVLEAGRYTDGPSEEEGSTQTSSEVADDAEHGVRPFKRTKSRRARPVEQMGEVPHDAVISAAQAESALGHNLATEWDEDVWELVDDDQRAEEEQLVGRVVHPDSADIDYSLLCWSPDPTDVNHSPDWINSQDMNWHPGLPVRRLTRQDFKIDRESVRSVLQESVDELAANCAAEINSAASLNELDLEVSRLDPTQRLLYEHIASWAQSKQTWLNGRWNNAPAFVCAPPALHKLLLGTAGTGKTHTAKLAIRKARRVFGRYNSVLTLAFSGVAAANLGGGSRTIDSVFHTNDDKALDDAIGDRLDELVAQLGHVELLLVDEISTVGAAQFEIMNRRLQQVARVVHRQRFGTEPPDDMGSFGGIGVVLMGDFAQLPPVLATSLLMGNLIMERHASGLRGYALAGQKTFRNFTQVLRLRRIHRQKGPDAFKESTMRLRDAAITLEDYELWKEHEVDSIDPTHTAPWEGGEKLLSNGLTLVATNKQAGTVNGTRLAAAAHIFNSRMPLAAPGQLSAAQVVVRCEARHTHPHRCEMRKSQEFRNIRKALHLRVGAKVILCLNFLWDVSTVPLGLMNGARGIIVAIAYAEPAGSRVDESPLAGTGFPQSSNDRLPRGLDNCPVPDFIVVNFPEYTGRAIFSNLPRTWVPIPSEQVTSDKSKSLARVNIPLRLAWALTFHKCQGLTVIEGTIISFLGSNMPAPASKVGLPFVGWTRATTWAGVAFHGLPPLEEFLAVRTTPEFRARSEFEAHADSLHEAFLQEQGVTHEQQVVDHKVHLNNLLMRKENRRATEEELKDIETMLCKRGVAPLSDSVKAWAAHRTGNKSSNGFWTMLASFKASRRAKDVADEKGAKKPQNTAKAFTCAQEVTKHLLQEYGYSEKLIQAALLECGSSLTRCQSYIEQIQAGFSAEDDMVDVVNEELWAHNVMHELGFSEPSINAALEKTYYDFPKALAFLLYGDVSSQNHLKQMQRHTVKRNIPAAFKVPLSDKLAQYVERAQVDLRLVAEAKDFGMHAGRTVNACFWLSLAAALTRSSWVVTTRHHDSFPGFQSACDAGIPDDTKDIRNSAVATFAVQLRHHMCFGDGAAMLKSYIRDSIYQAFAALGVGGPPRTLQSYKCWVAKLASNEFADELVVLATAMELNVRIVCVPYTPPGRTPWQISRYPPEGVDVISGATIYLGNDNVHYVWLRPTNS